ncbi:hypothetical protein [Thalassospira alkalitolerans]|uniref:hypothetical protein n=1 Tax=Thalassospira alkalitolerans TaxID=1293890 RepID=UPI003AA8E99D
MMTAPRAIIHQRHEPQLTRQNHEMVPKMLDHSETKITVPDNAFQKRVHTDQMAVAISCEFDPFGNATRNNGRDGGGKCQQKKNLTRSKPLLQRHVGRFKFKP